MIIFPKNIQTNKQAGSHLVPNDTRKRTFSALYTIFHCDTKHAVLLCPHAAGRWLRKSFSSDLPVLTESPCTSQYNIYLGIKGTAAHPGHIWGAEYKEDAQQSRLVCKLETTSILNGDWLACGKTLLKNTGRIRSRVLLSCTVTNCALKIAGRWF